MDLTVTQTNPIKGTIHAADKFVYRGTAGNNPRQELFATVVTSRLEIVGVTRTEGPWVGLEVKSQSVIDGIDSIRVVSKGFRTGLVFEDGGTYDYRGTIILADESPEGTGDARIEAGESKPADLTLANVIVEKGKANLQGNQASAIAVEHLAVGEDAALAVGAWGNTNAEASVTLSEVELAKNAELYAVSHSRGNQTISFQGDIALTMAEGSTFDMVREGDVTEATFDADSLTVRVEDAVSANVYLSEANTTLEGGKITVTGLPSSNSGDVEADLEALAGVVQFATKKKEEGEGGETVIDSTDTVVGVTVHQMADDFNDGASGTVGENGVENVVREENGNVYGIAEMNTLGLHIWRNEINDMGKRLGDLRTSRGQENGLWARVYTGKAEIGSLSVENDYTAFQFGYDRQIRPDVFVGAAFSYTAGDNDFSMGSGENRIYALTGYGSYVAENGVFVDLTAKYGRLENEFDIRLENGAKSSGDYDANAFSVSAEAGKRFELPKGFFVEPQVELMYGWVEDVDYTTSTGLKVRHDKAETLIGRAGFVFGAECPNGKGNAYVRASILNDFMGEADYSFVKSGEVRRLADDLGGSWYELGIGANVNWTDRIRSYVDVETASGGEVDTDWRLNVGVRYAF